MKNNYSILICILYIFILTKCTEQFNPDVHGTSDIIVIDGEINNLEGPYTVRISKTFDYNNPYFEYVTNASVEIHCNDGTIEMLEETKDGIYMTTSESFRGEIGKAYKLRVVTEGELIFESVFDTIRQPIPIDTIYSEFNSFSDQSGKEISNMDIFVALEDRGEETYFFYYSYIETWKIMVPNRYRNTPGALEKIVCYEKNNSSLINLKSTFELAGNKLDHIQIASVPETTHKLKLEYGIQVKQHRISSVQYEFYQKLEETNVNLGTLFDPIPYKVEGNVYCVNKPEHDVIGSFSVSGTADTHYFLREIDLPNEYTASDENILCKEHNLENQDKEYLDWTYIGLDCHPRSALVCRLVSFFVNYKECADCTLRGTNIKPENWPY